MVVLTDYQFQLGSSGILLNADGTGLPFVDIERVSGLDSPEFRETFRDHEGMDGGFMDAEFERGREIILYGTVYADSSNTETYLDNLKYNYAPLASPVTSVPLYLKAPGLAQRFINVKPRGVRYDWEMLRRIGITSAQFLMYAEDPRQYDDLLQSVVIAFGGPATTGIGFDLGFNLDFGATVPPSGSYVVVAGNRPTPAILTVAGPVENPRIINSTDNKTLDFFISIPTGSSLVIDLLNRTVKLDGANRRGTMTTAEWFLFNPGSTFIQFGGGSGTGTLLIEYRNAWR